MTTQTRAQIDKFLTNVSNKIMPAGYISEEILPLINVAQSSGKIPGYGKDHLRIVSTLTSGKNKYDRVDTRTENSVNYFIESHGLSDLVTERDVANYDTPFNAMVDTTSDLTTKLWLGKEKSLADTLTNTGVITNNVTLAGTDQYNDYANSDPLGDFVTARGTIYDNVGTDIGITAIMSWRVANTLSTHPALVRALGFADSRPGGLDFTELARALQVDRVLIGRAIYNSANEGQPDVLAPVWGKDIVFAIAPTTASRMQVSLGYRLQQFGQPRRVFRAGVNNPPNATEILVDDNYDQVLTMPESAYLIKDAIA